VWKRNRLQLNRVGILSLIVHIIAYPLVGQKQKQTVDVHRYTDLCSVSGLISLSNWATHLRYLLCLNFQNLVSLREGWSQVRETKVGGWSQVTETKVGPNCMKYNDFLIVGSGHGMGLGQWLQWILGDKYSVTSVLTSSATLCSVVRNLVALCMKGTLYNNCRGEGLKLANYGEGH
jgi:hypothetical protein